MKRALKTGIATLGLGLLLGLGTSAIAQTNMEQAYKEYTTSKEEKEQKQIHEKMPYTTITGLSIKVLENTKDIIKVEIEYEVITPHQEKPALLEAGAIVINGSKYDKKICIDQIWRYRGEEETQFYEGRMITPALEHAAKRLLEQEAYRSEEQKDLSPWIYDLLTAFEIEET